MINTVNSALPHYIQGFFTTGSGPLEILILGSCRVVPYVNYFDWLNTGNRFTIHLIDVVNFAYDATGQQVDSRQFTIQYEQKNELLAMLKRVRWFIHEHTENFGMFNTERSAIKNIYQFGCNPQVDISLPNWNDIFILFQELVDLDPVMRERFRKELATLKTISQQTLAEVREAGLTKIDKFLAICQKTSLPELGTAFTMDWRQHRWFWTGNHVSNRFTTVAMALLNEKFLSLDTPPSFWALARQHDPYATPCTRITEYDVKAFRLNWSQPVEPLKI